MHYYRDEHSSVVGQQCVHCPIGANCTEEGLSLESLPMRAGHWRYSNTSRVVSACRVPSACPGGPFPSPHVPGALAPCADGHTGILCDPCEQGYFQLTDGANRARTHARTHARAHTRAHTARQPGAPPAAPLRTRRAARAAPLRTRRSARAAPDCVLLVLLAGSRLAAVGGCGRRWAAGRRLSVLALCGR